MPVARSSGDFLRANFESERFEHFHRSNADVRFVITHKCVVPKNDFASSGSARLAHCFCAPPKIGVLALEFRDCVA